MILKNFNINIHSLLRQINKPFENVLWKIKTKYQFYQFFIYWYFYLRNVSASGYSVSYKVVCSK